jgi:hypothetical protein
MSDVKQRKKGAADGATSAQPKKQPAATKKDEKTESSLGSLLFIIIVGSALFFGCSYYFTNSLTFGITLEHLRDPNKLMATMHETLKSAGVPNFHGETVAAEVDAATGEVKKFGNANQGTEEVAQFQSSRLKVFTAREVEQYDGENGRPVFLGVKGRVYDVSKGSLFLSLH